MPDVKFYKNLIEKILKKYARSGYCLDSIKRTSLTRKDRTIINFTKHNEEDKTATIMTGYISAYFIMKKWEEIKGVK